MDTPVTLPVASTDVIVNTAPVPVPALAVNVFPTKYPVPFAVIYADTTAPTAVAVA